MNPQIQVNGLVKTFGSNTVVNELDLAIDEGEFLVLLGPSGCGKTTTLRCLAGLETPSSGEIVFGGRTVFGGPRRVDVPTSRRSIGMVFQSYALWPHMTVRQNIRYPLKVRRMKEGLGSGWVEDAAEMVECSSLLDRYPSQLSGGQQQRVALARGLVARPDLMLFDEPLSNLDARLRDQVRTQIHQLHRKLGFTAVFVTHDQGEALALGDRMAIMRGGAIEQCDAPKRVFERPASEYVAEFIGMGNRLELRRTVDGWQTVSGCPIGVEVDVDRGHEAVARIRHDDVSIFKPGESVPSGFVALPAVFRSSEYGGRHYDVEIEHAGSRLRVTTEASDELTWVERLTVGEALVAGFDPARARFFGSDGLAATAVGRSATAGV